jgi:predicted nucleotidyltransferase
MIASLEEVGKRLNQFGVDYIVIGGWAGLIHGVARSTNDVDVVYNRSDENLQRLVAATQDLTPYLRGAPPGLPFHWDAKTIRAGLNFTLTTSIGDIDFLGEVAGGGTYEQLLHFTQSVTAFGITCRVATLEKLIQLKRAAGRPKDLEAIAELEALREERDKMKRGE